MSILYKFKNVVDFDAVKFDGVYISASDLRAIISQQKKLTNCGVQIINEETGQVYGDDQQIPKNTKVIITRVPLANNNKRSRMNNANNSNNNNTNSSGNTNGNATNHHNNHHHHYRNNHNHHHSQSSASSFSQDHPTSSSTSNEAFELVSSKPMTEQEKIKQIQNQSTKDFDPSRYARGRGGGGGGYRGGRGGRNAIHDGYRCRKCGIPGHSIYDCRNSLQPKVKKAHGIPRDFLMKADAKDKGALMTPSGEYAVPILDREAYSNPKVEKAPFFDEGISSDDTTTATS